MIEAPAQPLPKSIFPSSAVWREVQSAPPSTPQGSPEALARIAESPIHFSAVGFRWPYAQRIESAQAASNNGNGHYAPKAAIQALETEEGATRNASRLNSLRGLLSAAGKQSVWLRAQAMPARKLEVRPLEASEAQITPQAAAEQTIPPGLPDHEPAPATVPPCAGRGVAHHTEPQWLTEQLEFLPPHRAPLITADSRGSSDEFKILPSRRVQYRQGV